MLGEDRLNELAVHISEPEIATLKSIGQFFVIEAEQMQNRRVQIVHVHFVAHDPEAEFIGFAKNGAGLDASAGEPHGKRIDVMIAYPITPQSEAAALIG